MDALWIVCDQVFTSQELEKFSIGEAFVLSAAFYIHDLAMAMAATPEGRKTLEASHSYQSCIAQLTSSHDLNEEDAKLIALRVSARETHAQNADWLVDRSLPGLDRFLVESKEIRDSWGDYIGKVAASHHWSIQKVDANLGHRGRLPDASSGAVDLGFVACALRIIDYAHINAGRASSLDRVLRARISEDSIVHWYAQERISGPRREGDLLVYASMRPITDVDAWWIFYEMATGLDREITAVADYLNSRAISVDRFSLEGVKGVRSPQAFATLVRPHDFEPVDIRFRPDSMSRLVGLLGGRTLYGDDFFAPIRELLQNARDAIHLRQAIEKTGTHTRGDSSSAGARAGARNVIGLR